MHIHQEIAVVTTSANGIVHHEFHNHVIKRIPVRWMLQNDNRGRIAWAETGFTATYDRYMSPHLPQQPMHLLTSVRRRGDAATLVTVALDELGLDISTEILSHKDEEIHTIVNEIDIVIVHASDTRINGIGQLYVRMVRGLLNLRSRIHHLWDLPISISFHQIHEREYVWMD